MQMALLTDAYTHSWRHTHARITKQQGRSSGGTLTHMHHSSSAPKNRGPYAELHVTDVFNVCEVQLCIETLTF